MIGVRSQSGGHLVFVGRTLVLEKISRESVFRENVGWIIFYLVQFVTLFRTFDPYLFSRASFG